MALTNKSISSWVRQARYRAKKHNIYSDLTINDIQTILDTSESKCSYCGNAADTLDCPFPLKKDGPHVPANVVPCCRACKTLKSNNDIVWMFSNNHIDQHKYLDILQKLFDRRGGDLIREHIRKATGLINGDSDE